MKHISLDGEDERIQHFVRSLSVDPDGSILEINGEAVIRVSPVALERPNEKQLREGIRKRRDASRILNSDWESVDSEIWNQFPESKE